MKNYFLNTAILLAVCLLTACENESAPENSVAASETSQNRQATLEQQIDTLLSGIYPENEPGVSVILAKGDEVLYRSGHGMADLEHNISISPEMIFRLGSLSKQITATGIMMLKEEGKLAIDDPISRYFPDYPTHGYTITIRHLLTHTSGIIDFLAIETFPAIEKIDLTALDVIDFFKDQALNFAPGDAYSYTNSGYVLLGAIIEQISGQSYEAFIQERIFTPLGMNQTYHGNFKRIIPGRVTGYARAENGFENSAYLSMTIPGAAGAIISTVDDLLIWNTALFSGEIVSRDSLQEMTSPFVLNNGELSNYGFGLALQTLRSQTMFSHTGGINGFITYAAYLPDSDLYVAVLGNTGYQSRVYEANSMLAMAIGDPYPSKKFQSVNPELLDTYTGDYQTIRGIHFAVSVNERGLAVSINGGADIELSAITENVFYLPNSFTHIEFSEAEASDSLELVFYTNEEGSDGQVARLVN